MKKIELINNIINELKIKNSWDFGKTEFYKAQLKKANKKELERLYNDVFNK